MIHGLSKFLEGELESLDYVESIFPGEIKRTKGANPKLRVQFKYATETGAKLLSSIMRLLSQGPANGPFLFPYPF